MHKNKSLMFAVFAIAPGLTALVQGQETESELRLEVVTVTAQKIEQDLQQVPISVTTVQGSALEARQIDSFDQLQFVAPGLSFNAGVNASQSASTIRGIGTGLFNPGIEASTAVAIDGVIIGREGAGLFDFADVERVEVLRGPQGTLFGKNASAGVISIITRAPTSTFEGAFNIAYGSFDEVNLSGSLAGPLTDRVTGRIAAYSNTRDGYVDNVNPDAGQDKVNERNEQGLRARIRIEFSADSELLLSADYVQRDQAQGALTHREFSTPGEIGSGFLPAVFVPINGGIGPQLVADAATALGIEPGPENLKIGSEALFTSAMDAWGLSAHYAHSLGAFEWVSLTSYREWTSFDNNDADLVPLPLLSINNGHLAQHQFSQEIRLDSPRDQALTYTLGLYYFEQHLDVGNIQGGSFPLGPRGALLPFGTDLRSAFSERNYAVFGQGEFAVTDQFSLIAGLRVLNSAIEGEQEKFVAEGFIAPFLGQSVSSGRESAADDDRDIVWRLGAQYYLSGATNFFATVSRGYKAAGIVTGPTINPLAGNTLPVVAPERPTQYEAGVRHSGFDGRLIANLTLFYTQVEDFQQQALIPNEGGIVNFGVANAGIVESQGFEAELTALPSEGLTLSVALAHTKAVFDEFLRAPCDDAFQTAAEGCVTIDGARAQDLSGNRLPNSPDWIINALARYDFDLNVSYLSRNWKGFAQWGLQYRGDTDFANNNDPRQRQDAYALVDAQLGVHLPHERGTVSVFGRNLTDESFVESIVGSPFDAGGLAQFLTLESQRTWGVKLSLDF